MADFRSQLKIYIYEFVADYIQNFLSSSGHGSPNSKSTDNLLDSLHATFPESVCGEASHVTSDKIKLIDRVIGETIETLEGQTDTSDAALFTEVRVKFQELDNFELLTTSLTDRLEESAKVLDEANTAIRVDPSSYRLKKLYTIDFEDHFNASVASFLHQNGTIDSWTQFFEILSLSSVLMLVCTKDDDNSQDSDQHLTSIRSTLSYLASLCENSLIKHNVLPFLKENADYYTKNQGIFITEQESELDNTVAEIVSSMDQAMPSEAPENMQPRRANELSASSCTESWSYVDEPMTSEKMSLTTPTTMSSENDIPEENEELDKSDDADETVFEGAAPGETIKYTESSETIKAASDFNQFNISKSPEFKNRPASPQDCASSPKIMLQPVDDSTESLPDEPAPPQPQQQLPAGPASALTANTGLHTGTKSHEDVRRLIAAASSSALLEKDAEATPTFPNAESVGSAIEFQTTENDGDDGGCVMATGLVESGDESASVEASTPSRRESRARRESGANPSELAAILEKSQEMAPAVDGLVGESSEQEIDAPVVVPSPRNLSVDSKESSVLTSVTPTTPPLASYSSSHYAHVTPNEATNDSVPNLQVQSTIGEVDIQSEHSDDILKSDAVKSITKEVQESGQDFLRKRTVEEPVKEVKNLPSESPEKLSPCHSQSGMNLGTAAAIGGAVAGLSAFLYLKLK